VEKNQERASPLANLVTLGSMVAWIMDSFMWGEARPPPWLSSSKRGRR
jgi:hypothetical protein